MNVEEIRRPYWLLTLKQLVGLDIWGGAGQIMLGEEKLADRFGYVDIALTDDWDSVIEQHVSSNQEKET